MVRKYALEWRELCAEYTFPAEEMIRGQHPQYALNCEGLGNCLIDPVSAKIHTAEKGEIPGIDARC